MDNFNTPHVQPFYNSINLNNKELSKENANSLKQEEFITAIFKANLNKPISPSQIHKVYGKEFSKSVPLTSIRRAITNLTSKEVLRKTSIMVTGAFGKPEYCWVMESKKIHLEFIEDEKDDIPSGVGGGYGFRDILGC